MIVILEKYRDTKYKHEKTVREELYSALVLHKYLFPKFNLCIGTDPNEKLPDIINEDRTIGFEVVNCETNLDYEKMDIERLLQQKNYVYDKEISERIEEFKKKFGGVELVLTIDDNIVKGYSSLVTFHYQNFMLEPFKNEIEKKLKKLNKGNYKNCQNVSLVIINHEKLNGENVAKTLQQAYNEVGTKYKKLFTTLYFISQLGFFEIKNSSITTIHKFKDDDINMLVKEINEKLQ